MTSTTTLSHIAATQANSPSEMSATGSPAVHSARGGRESRLSCIVLAPLDADSTARSRIRRSRELRDTARTEQNRYLNRNSPDALRRGRLRPRRTSVLSTNSEHGAPCSHYGADQPIGSVPTVAASLEYVPCSPARNAAGSSSPTPSEVK